MFSRLEYMPTNLSSKKTHDSGPFDS